MQANENKSGGEGANVKPAGDGGDGVAREDSSHTWNFCGGKVATIIYNDLMSLRGTGSGVAHAVFPDGHPGAISSVPGNTGTRSTMQSRRTGIPSTSQGGGPPPGGGASSSRGGALSSGGGASSSGGGGSSSGGGGCATGTGSLPPEYGESSPVGGESSPVGGDSPPVGGGSASGEGGSPPVGSGSASGGGGSPPVGSGSASYVEGGSPPPGGGSAPGEGGSRHAGGGVKTERTGGSSSAKRKNKTSAFEASRRQHLEDLQKRREARNAIMAAIDSTQAMEKARIAKALETASMEHEEAEMKLASAKAEHYRTKLEEVEALMAAVERLSKHVQGMDPECPPCVREVGKELLADAIEKLAEARERMRKKD